MYLNVGFLKFVSWITSSKLDCVSGKTRKIVDKTSIVTSYTPRLSILKQPFSCLAKLVFNLRRKMGNILSLEVWFPYVLLFKTMIFRYSSFLGERYLIKLPSADSCFTIDSMVYFIDNEVNRWYIQLDIRGCMGKRPSINLGARHGWLAVTHEWTKIAFTAIWRWSNWISN